MSITERGNDARWFLLIVYDHHQPSARSHVTLEEALAVAHPLLRHAHRDTGRSHRGPERVAQVVESVGVDVGCSEGSAVAAYEGTASQDIAGRGLGEHKGVRIAPARRLLPPTKLLRKLAAQRHAAGRPAALGRVELAEKVVAHNADPTLDPLRTTDPIPHLDPPTPMPERNTFDLEVDRGR